MTDSFPRGQVLNSDLSPRGVFPPDRHPEIELLLEAARNSPDASAVNQMRTQASQITDWPRFIFLASKNRVLPQIYKNFSALGVVPAAVLQLLRQNCFEQNRRQLVLEAGLCSVFDLFEKEGIAVMPFKGALLSHLLYQNANLREYYDIDLLVTPEQVLQAKQVLENAGFIEWQHDQSAAQKKATMRAENHFQMASPCRSYLVELHWDFFPWNLAVDAFQKDLRGFWERSVRIEWKSRSILSPHPEDYFLILCIHGSKHLWERLGWISDIAQFLEIYPQMNLNKLRSRAKAQGIERMLLLGLHLAEKLQGKSQERGQVSKANLSPFLALRQHAIQRMFSLSDEKPRAIESGIFHLRMRERVCDRIHYIVRNTVIVLTPTAEEWKRVPLPDALFFLYYLIRPIRLTWKYLCQVFVRTNHY